MMSAHVLDDDPASRQALAKWLAKRGFGPVVETGTVKQAKAELAKGWPDLLLIDLELPDGRGTDLLDDPSASPLTQVVVVTGVGSIDSAVSSMRRGAIDYLTKPVDLERLAKIAESVSRTAELQHEVGRLRNELRALGRYGRLVGASAAMQEVYDLLEKAAPTMASVFITGETGSGKEVVAQTIHDLSPRRDKPFIAVNCGAIPENLIESELFGHEKGAFTGAIKQHAGVFEQADGGTLFLDELAEMPASLQVRLLRVLETSELKRVGGSETIRFDTRVIAATNREPAKAVAENYLREDLMYRLMVVLVGLPPLRERREDIPLLAEHFLAAANRTGDKKRSLDPGAVDKLLRHDWPGNVRELRNVIERACVTSGDVIHASDVPLLDVGDPPSGRTDGVFLPFGTTLEKAQRELFLQTLEWLDGDRGATASTLGVSPKTLYNRLKKYEEDGGDE